jgi:general secretion pathway protein I
MSTRARGFTLIEVVIALFVVALGIGALLNTLVSSAESVGRLRDKSLAEWIALNRISEVRLKGGKPDTGVTNGTIDYAGRPWIWQQAVTDPGMAGMLRIDVRVALSDGRKLSTATAVAASADAAQSEFPGIATAYGFIGTSVGQATGIDPDWSIAAAAKPPGAPGAPGAPDGGKPDAGTK